MEEPGIRWAQSPIVVLPVIVGTFALVAWPFVLAKSENAFSFYGAFIAAVIAAAAIIANSRYMNWLEAQKEGRRRIQEQTEKALFLWSFLSRVQAYLGGVIAVYQSAHYQTVAAPQPHDQTVFTVKQFRAALRSPGFNFDDAAAHCVTLPPEVALLVTRAMNMAALTFSDVMSFPWAEESTCVWRENMEKAVVFANGAMTTITAGNTVLAEFLRARKYLT